MNEEVEIKKLSPSLRKRKSSKFSIQNLNLMQKIKSATIVDRHISSDNIVEVLQVIDSKMGAKFNLVEANDLLKIAGILDDSGKLAAQYR